MEGTVRRVVGGLGLGRRCRADGEAAAELRAPERLSPDGRPLRGRKWNPDGGSRRWETRHVSIASGPLEPNPSQAGSPSTCDGTVHHCPPSGFLLRAAQQEGQSHVAGRARGEAFLPPPVPAGSRATSPAPGGDAVGARSLRESLDSLAGRTPEVLRPHALPHSALQGGEPGQASGVVLGASGSWECHRGGPGINSTRRGVPSLKVLGAGCRGGAHAPPTETRGLL